MDTISAWPANQNASFLTNHDQTRIMTELGGDLPSAKLAAFILLNAPGTPFVYYGEEIGMTGTKPDERIRTPMRWSMDEPAAGFSAVDPWQALSDDAPEVNVATQSDDPDSLLATYRDLVRVRNATPALRRGATTLVEGGAEPVIAWLRTTADETLLVVVNVSDEPVDTYGLALDGGPLCGQVTARLVGTIGGDPGATPAAPAGHRRPAASTATSRSPCWRRAAATSSPWSPSRERAPARAAGTRHHAGGPAGGAHGPGQAATAGRRGARVRHDGRLGAHEPPDHDRGDGVARSP